METVVWLQALATVYFTKEEQPRQVRARFANLDTLCYTGVAINV